MTVVIRVPVAAARGLGSRMPHVTRTPDCFKVRPGTISQPGSVIAVTGRGIDDTSHKAVA